MKVYAYGHEINTAKDSTLATFRITPEEDLLQVWVELKATADNLLYVYASSNERFGYLPSGEERDPANEITFPENTDYSTVCRLLSTQGANEDEIKATIPKDFARYHTLDIDPIGLWYESKVLFDPQDAELSAETFNRLAGDYDLSDWLELDQQCGGYTRREQYKSLKEAGYDVDAVDYFTDEDKE